MTRLTTTMMVVDSEQQAKLGVSAEESKAHRLQRQQARFRDRGGAFVPSNTNPLVDILLARTVSGESPSKPRPKDVTPKRLSPSKARRKSAVTPSDENQAIAGSSKAKQAPRKRKEKVADDSMTKPAPKRRGRGKKKAADADSDTEKPAPNTKPKSVSKGKGKQRDTNIVISTSDGKSKRKVKPKSNTAKAVETLFSDDDHTLVDAPHKANSNCKRNMRSGDDDETDDDTAIVKKQVLPQASHTKNAKRAKADKIAGMGDSGKKMEDGEITECPETNSKRRLVPHGRDDSDGVATPPAKKGKAPNATSAKPKKAIEPDPAIKSGETSRATGYQRGKGKDEFIEEEEDEPAAECTSKAKKRKKEDNYDDRPQKTAKFSEIGHPSSQKLKENKVESGKRNPHSNATDDPDALRPKLPTKPPSRANSKGPPRKVLERIKASAVRHLQCADSEPDELDCLS